MSDDKKDLSCSFCGQKEEDVDHLISGGEDLAICSDCLEACTAIMEDEKAEAKQGGGSTQIVPSSLKPKDIHKHLDDYVIGQGAAKKTLAVAVYNHYKRINALGNAKKQSKQDVSLDKEKTLGTEPASVELQKSNVILMGPTGSGKTLLAQTLAKVLNVPFSIADATTLTEAGYVGEDVENILVGLVQAADYDIDRAQQGIIYIDEIDKIARKSDSASLSRDVSGEGVQQALLKIIEGTVSSIPPKGGRKHPQQELVQIDTTNILFICGGAFVGLDRVVKNRMGTKSIGFGATVTEEDKSHTELFEAIQPEDLLKFGLIPEFVGRLPVIAALQELDEADLVRILKEPKNALTRQYRELFSFEDVELDFTEGALLAAAAKAIERKSGARGLRSVLEEAMLDIMYDIPSIDDVQKCVITEEVINDGEYPVLVYKEK